LEQQETLASSVLDILQSLAHIAGGGAQMVGGQ